MIEAGPTPAPSVAPELFTQFRMTQLLILLDEIAPPASRGVHLERMGYYEFFSANPFAVIGPNESRARSQLHHAAFDERQLSYASTGTRFANRRQRLQHDVALLVAYGLVALRDSGFSATPKGHEFVGELSSLYASQFRASVRVIHSQFKRLSDTQLAKASREWLQSPSLILDLYGSSEFEQVGANG